MREGPLITRSCQGCAHLARRSSALDLPHWACTYYGGFRAIDDAEAKTPDWCPVPTPREVKSENMR